MSNSVQPHRWLPTRLRCPWDGDLYVVGGSIPRRMWKCNNATVDWEWCAPLPRDRLQHTLVSVPGKDAIYSLGGKTLQDTLSNAVIYYRVGDNVWTETTQLEVAVSGAAGANLNGIIYLLGGEENDLDFFTKPSRLIQCFDTDPRVATVTSGNFSWCLWGVRNPFVL